MTHPSYASGRSDHPLIGETISTNFRRARERWPDREALVVRHQDYRATYRALWNQVEEAARALLASGIEKGDRVGLWAPNRYEWVVVQFATARIGAILVNVNPAYKATELEYALRQSGIRLLFMAARFRQSNYVELLSTVREQATELKETVVLDSEWEDFLQRSSGASLQELETREQSLEFDDPINIQYTSGTTGAPKGATLSHHNILNNAYFVGRACGYSEQDRVCIPVPFYHCFGMVLGNLACVSHGAAMVVASEAFEPGSVLKCVAEEKCTSLYGVPTMFIAMLADPVRTEVDLSSLRTGIMAGSPCPVEVMKQVRTDMHLDQITICYGMTETSPVSTQTAMNDSLEKRVSTVGRVHPHVEVKIIDSATGRMVPRTQSGELCTRGYCVMLGYWNNNDATTSAIDRAGWMHTGDLAVMDDQGYIKIVGRLKDMVIRGGENIYPREIEEFLYTHPDIEDAHVFGVPSEKYGEEVMAWVKPKGGANLTPEALDRFCRGKIATFKIPRYWKIVDTFPMTVTGKIQKFKMREQAVKELGLARADAIETA